MNVIRGFNDGETLDKLTDEKVVEVLEKATKLRQLHEKQLGLLGELEQTIVKQLYEKQLHDGRTDGLVERVYFDRHRVRDFGRSRRCQRCQQAFGAANGEFALRLGDRYWHERKCCS
jgi:hypothetical protein